MEINIFSSYETYLLQNNHDISLAIKISRRKLFFATKNYVSSSMKYKDGKKKYSSLANCVSTQHCSGEELSVKIILLLFLLFYDTFCITIKKKASIIQLEVQYPCRRN
jgi:hypothetical protein